MPILPLIVVLFGSNADPTLAVHAAPELAHLIAAAPADAAAAARGALETRDFERAADLAALAAARAPASADAALLLGLARFRGGHPERAVAPFTRAVALAPASATARFNLASALYQSGEIAAAERRYGEAAQLDAKVTGLARYDAALAALDRGHPDDAEVHLAAATRAARAAGQTALADKAAALAASLATRSQHGVAPEIRELARAAKAALGAHRYEQSADLYQRAAAAAAAENAPAADRGELYYGLGSALWRANRLTSAARAFEAALEQLPGDPEFHYMLGLVHFDAGADRDAQIALERALALHLSDGQAARARDILRALKQAHRGETSRFYLELRAAGGYDTNVPQSGVVLTVARAQGEPTDSTFLEADLDLFWRPAGNARNGLSVEYRFGQVAYLADALDPYSLQEHDLTVSSAWTPTPRLTLELGADGFLQLTGIASFAAFQAGGSAGPRITVREPHNLETRLRYQHVLKLALDRTYQYLGGNRDEAGIAEQWRDPSTRVALGYLFAREAVGTQLVTLADLVLPLAKPGSYDPNAVYFIPYAYLGHEVSLGVTRDLPRDFRAALNLRYEHRDYDGFSYIEPPAGSSQQNPRKRRDNRFGVDLALRHPIGAGFDIELAYTFIVNRSTIDNTRATTPLDYDDKSYLKHILQLDFSFVY